MSSIYGIYNFTGEPAETNLLLARAALSHWRSDADGFWAEKNVGLGHLMRYNAPESLSESLPLADSERGLVITADVCVYNREEICRLLNLHQEEKNVPDSSLILLLYVKYGFDCVCHIVGDFAFAIWDSKKNILFCARDHMGVKPFFYYHDSRFIAIATEKKGLLCLPGINKSINRQFFYNQVYEPAIQAADETLYEHIFRLPPAHTLTCNVGTGKLSLSRYWTLDPYREIKFAQKQDYFDGLRQYFEEAVSCRLRSAYPTGVELSGGLDSSAVTGVASHLLRQDGKNIISFSNVEGSGFDIEKISPDLESDMSYIRDVVAFNHISECFLISEDIWQNPEEELEFAMQVNDGLELRSMLWQSALKRAAEGKGVRTLLSGFPGDEMVTYLGNFYFLNFLDKQQYRKYLTAPANPPFAKWKPFSPERFSFVLHKLKNINNLNNRDIRIVSDIFDIPLKYRINKGDVVWRDPYFLSRFKSYRHHQIYRLLKAQVSLRMEAENRFGLYYGTETRYPMADIRLTQYYLSLPNELKYEGRLRRNAFREAMKNYLPVTILTRDNKKSHIAPFRNFDTAAEEKEKMLESLLKKLNKHKIFHEISQSNSLKKWSLTSSFLENLSWWQKNFGSF